MPILQREVFRAVDTNDLARLLDCAVAAPNYAERVATNLAMNVRFERLARHSLAFGINVQAESGQSTNLPHRLADPTRQRLASIPHRRAHALALDCRADTVTFPNS